MKVVRCSVRGLHMQFKNNLFDRKWVWDTGRDCPIAFQEEGDCSSYAVVPGEDHSSIANPLVSYPCNVKASELRRQSVSPDTLAVDLLCCFSANFFSE